MHEDSYGIDEKNVLRLILNVQMGDKLFAVQVNVYCKISWNQQNINSAFTLFTKRIGNGNFRTIEEYRESLQKKSVEAEVSEIPKDILDQRAFISSEVLYSSVICNNDEYIIE